MLTKGLTQSGLCSEGIFGWGTLRAQARSCWLRSRCNGQRQILSRPRICELGRHPRRARWISTPTTFACLWLHLWGTHSLQHVENTILPTNSLSLISLLKKKKMELSKKPEIKDVARPTLLGTSGVREGPVIREGITVMRSMLFSSANSQAVFSANVLDSG